MVKKVFEKFRKNITRKKSETSGVETMNVKKKTTKKTVKPKKTTTKVSFKDLSGDQLNSLISHKAYELFVERGYSHGNDIADWVKAEKLVMKSLKK